MSEPENLLLLLQDLWEQIEVAKADFRNDETALAILTELQNRITALGALAEHQATGCGPRG